MELVPKWFSQWPNRHRKPPDFFNLGKFFEDLDISLPSSGLGVSADDHHIYIEAHVPGLTSKDIEVTIDKDHVLWIKGRKEEEKDDKKRKFYRHSQQSFSYCIPLWDEINQEREPKAICKDGVMRITFEKVKDKQGEGRKISVKEG